MDRAIKGAEAQFPDEIEHIRYSVGEDWAGDPAVFVRILLKDSPVTEMAWPDRDRGKAIFQLTRRISDALGSELQTDDLQAYFRFRSVSEQKELRDPAWD